MSNVPFLAMEDVFVGITAFHASVEIEHSNGFWAFRIAEGFMKKLSEDFVIILYCYIILHLLKDLKYGHDMLCNANI